MKPRPQALPTPIRPIQKAVTEKTKKPSYQELLDALERALDHLDYCGWGDSWERECSEKLQQELPEVLRRAKEGA